MKTSPERTGFLQRLILAVFLSLLIWEWIRTLPSVTDTDAAFLWMFMVPVLGVLGICLLLPWPWARILPSLLFVFYWYHHTLLDGPFLSLSWGREIWMKFRGSLPLITGMQWENVDPTVRTGLFYLFLCLAVHWLYQEMIVRKRLLFPVFLSNVYFSILDTFFAFDGKLPVIKAFVYGLAMLSIANLGRLHGQHRFRIPLRKKSLYLAASALLILSASLTGCFSPKGEPVWPDPVNFIQSVKVRPVTGEGGLFDSGWAKSGYGHDDTRLGGSFIQSEELVFTGSVTGKEYPEHYWRGESKEIYTGHGWEALKGGTVILPVIGTIPYRLLDSSVSGKELIEIVGMRKQDQTLLFTSGQPISIKVTKAEAIPTQRGESGGGAVTIQADPSHFRFQSDQPYERYVASSVIPVFSEQKLIELSDRLKNVRNPYPKEVMDRYLQLPETLPERVKHLADKVAGDETNLYKKVKAIESFLRSGVYSYDIVDVPLPSENQDYVDQFLFESRRGYCDNFSTAMAVMLRTQGIPARWVKGYAFGELAKGEETKNGTVFTVTVREKDAHSWVEVYFPGYGWVPFEPTPGFSYPYEVERPETEVSALPEQDFRQERMEKLLQEANEEFGNLDRSQLLKEKEREQGVPSGRLHHAILPVAVLLLAAILLFILIFILRTPLWLAIQAARVRHGKGRETVIRAYEILLYYLEKTYSPRNSGQTLREYASSLDMKEGREELTQLTKLFEQVRYGGKMPATSRREFYARWKEALKRLRPR